MKKLVWILLGFASLYIVNSIFSQINLINIKELILILVLPLMVYEFSSRLFEYSKINSNRKPIELVKIILVFCVGFIAIDFLWLPQNGILYWLKYPLMAFAGYKAMVMVRNFSLMKVVNLKLNSLYHHSEN